MVIGKLLHMLITVFEINFCSFIRFAEIRNTFQGKLEERLPFFSFTFPPWFKTKYKRAYDNFKGNLKTLVTPFDIHATLKSVLHLRSLEKANLSERSLSLFSHVSTYKTILYISD